MKVINSLIAVEVPRGVKYTVRESEVAIFRNRALSVIQLPFPAEIIGLASEIDEEQVHEILRLSHALVWEIKGARDFMYMWLNKQYGVPLPTPTTDIIFLRKKL